LIFGCGRRVHPFSPCSERIERDSVFGFRAKVRERPDFDLGLALYGGMDEAYSPTPRKRHASKSER
jgi:hypothetical protein